MSPEDCILVIPASGYSRRFGVADKLLTDLGGRPLADYAAALAAAIGFTEMIAVVPSENAERADIFKRHGFTIVENENPHLGQAHTIQMGAHAVSNPHQGLCVMLADMPLVPVSHLRALIDAAPKDGVIKTLYKDHTQPPAVFTGQAREALAAGEYLSSPPVFRNDTVLLLSAPFGEDVDTAKDLKRLSRLIAK